MATTSLIPASEASRIASAAYAAGTKMIEVFAPVAFTAFSTELNTGTPSTDSPSFPGETPATTLVPYSVIRPV